MGRSVEHPCQHIVSFRLNNQDRDLLNQWSLSSGMSVSAILRIMFSHMGDSFADTLLEEAKPKKKKDRKKPVTENNG